MKSGFEEKKNPESKMPLYVRVSKTNRAFTSTPSIKDACKYSSSLGIEEENLFLDEWQSQIS